ncbi:MAG TPA: choice-of-anchor tandem repeat GloVer-containing protein [Verrucomicrobiae bacterium]|nr:choice-of-anchor tandem repeat GloVer-containing protein [Verrucomicrobiae bacterium]
MLNRFKLAILALATIVPIACQAQNSWMFTSLVPLTGTNGSGPYGELALGSDSLLYGTTTSGGAFGLGTVYNVTLGGALTTLCSFNGTNGSYPAFAPVLAGSSNCYGITANGGNGFDGNPYTGQGTIYQLSSIGVLTTLFAFSRTNGSEPCSLILGSDGNLYGTTAAGGANTNDPNNNFAGDGTAFEITTNGQFTLLASFDGTNGEEPRALLQGNDGNFYGVTAQGGAYGYGTVFQMTTNGQVATLASFAGTNGVAPINLIQGSDGALYGTTLYGGNEFNSTATPPAINGDGSVFRITTNGNLISLASFTDVTGATPIGRLLEVTNGVFLGTTMSEGPSRTGAANGTVYQITTNGQLTVLATAIYTAFHPEGGLAKAPDGNFYGPYGSGVFAVRPTQAPVLQASFQGGQISLSWNAWAGYQYAVMCTTNLTRSNWGPVQGVNPSTNGMTSISDSIGSDPQRFYTVIMTLSP